MERTDKASSGNWSEKVEVLTPLDLHEIEHPASKRFPEEIEQNLLPDDPLADLLEEYESSKEKLGTVNFLSCRYEEDLQDMFTTIMDKISVVEEKIKRVHYYMNP